MKYIKRTEVPPELVQLKKKYSRWDQIDHNNKKDDNLYRDLRQALLGMQNRRCAYCEVLLKVDEEAHIEHFFPRNPKNGTGKQLKKDFCWDNLFASCNNEASCGRFKDCKWPDDDVFKPDLELDYRVEDCFIYHPEGYMFPSSDLNQEIKTRAEKTIIFFGLNCPGLIRERNNIAQALRYAGVTFSDKVEQIKEEKGFDSVCDFWNSHEHDLKKSKDPKSERFWRTLKNKKRF